MIRGDAVQGAGAAAFIPGLEAFPAFGINGVVVVFEEAFGGDEVGFGGAMTERFGKGFQVPGWVARMGEIGVGELFRDTVSEKSG